MSQEFIVQRDDRSNNHAFLNREQPVNCKCCRMIRKRAGFKCSQLIKANDGSEVTQAKALQITSAVFTCVGTT